MLVKIFSHYLGIPQKFFGSFSESKKVMGSSINPAYTDMVFGGYNPKLLSSLRQEHREVLEYCESITLSAQKNDWFQVNVDLVDLMELVKEHRKVEFTYLYARLEYSYKTKSEEHDMINFIRREMKKTSESFLEFANHYVDVSEDLRKQQTFRKEFTRQHFALKTKIGLEENSLYPIYDLLFKKHNHY